MNQENTVQLQVNQLTTEFYAPVTTQDAKNQTQSRLASAQNRLASVRQDLETTRKQLAAMEAQGPPKK